MKKGILFNYFFEQPFFLRNSWCPLKKKGLHFDFISDFPISLPKSECSLKKKGFQSESFSEETSATDSTSQYWKL